MYVHSFSAGARAFDGANLPDGNRVYILQTAENEIVRTVEDAFRSVVQPETDVLGAGNFSHPQVVVFSNGAYLIAALENTGQGQHIVYQRYSSDHTKNGGKGSLLSATSMQQEDFHVAPTFDGTELPAFSWTDGQSIFTRRLGLPEQKIMSSGSSSQVIPYPLTTLKGWRVVFHRSGIGFDYEWFDSSNRLRQMGSFAAAPVQGKLPIASTLLQNEEFAFAWYNPDANVVQSFRALDDLRDRKTIPIETGWEISWDQSSKILAVFGEAAGGYTVIFKGSDGIYSRTIAVNDQPTGPRQRLVATTVTSLYAKQGLLGFTNGTGAYLVSDIAPTTTTGDVTTSPSLPTTFTNPIQMGETSTAMVGIATTLFSSMMSTLFGTSAPLDSSTRSVTVVDTPTGLPPTEGGMNTVAIAVAAVLGGLLCLGLIGIAIKCRRKQQGSENTEMKQFSSARDEPLSIGSYPNATDVKKQPRYEQPESPLRTGSTGSDDEYRDIKLPSSAQYVSARGPAHNQYQTIEKGAAPLDDYMGASTGEQKQPDQYNTLPDTDTEPKNPQYDFIMRDPAYDVPNV